MKRCAPRLPVLASASGGGIALLLPSVDAARYEAADRPLFEAKIKELEAETARMVVDAKERGEKDRQALIEEGRKVAAEVQAQVKQGIDIEVQKAKASLAVEASLLSVDLAEGKIKKTISPQDHERIVKEYISKVGGKG